MDAILHTPAARDIAELESFLGVINFDERFLPNLSRLIRPLHPPLIHGNSWERVNNQEKGITASEQLMTSAPILLYFKPGKPVKHAPAAAQFRPWPLQTMGTSLAAVAPSFASVSVAAVLPEGTPGDSESIVATNWSTPKLRRSARDIRLVERYMLYYAKF